MREKGQARPVTTCGQATAIGQSKVLVSALSRGWE